MGNTNIAAVIVEGIKSYIAEHRNLAAPVYLYIEIDRSILCSKEIVKHGCAYSRQHTENTLKIVNSLERYDSAEVHITEGPYACARYDNLVIAAGSQTEEGSNEIVDFFYERLGQLA